MKDYQTHLETLRKDAAECELISNLATDPQKRELFKKLAEDLASLATEVERNGRKKGGRVSSRSDGGRNRHPRPGAHSGSPQISKPLDRPLLDRVGFLGQVLDTFCRAG
jgi:hypothetical protein